MIIVIVGKQSTCPNEKQKDSRRVSNLVLTAHAGTLSVRGIGLEMLCVPHLGATENWTIEQLPYKDRTNASNAGSTPNAIRATNLSTSKLAWVSNCTLCRGFKTVFSSYPPFSSVVRAEI